jgi:hypothetical protein
VDNLQQYNAFGGLLIKHNRITVTITAVQNSRSIHRTLNKDVQLSDIGKTETCVAQFGILIDLAGQRHKVVMHEMLRPKSQKPLLDIPQVEQSINELANIVKKAIT